MCLNLILECDAFFSRTERVPDGEQQQQQKIAPLFVEVCNKPTEISPDLCILKGILHCRQTRKSRTMDLLLLMRDISQNIA